MSRSRPYPGKGAESKMDRRLIILAALTMAVAGSERLVARAEAEPPASVEPAPVPVPVPTPVEAPPPVPEPAPSAMPAAPLPAPASMPAVEPSAPLDPRVERAQVPILGARSTAGAAAGSIPKPGSEQGQGPLPPASESPGQGAGSSGAAREVDPFVLPADRLPLGRQTVGLTVEVVAPQVVNLNQVALLKVVVRNTGTADALGVVVRDQLPEGLDYISSQPEADRNDTLLFWKLGAVPAGSERVILVKVKTVKAGPFEHAATVSMLAGGKSRTIVREPKLKVELSATPGKMLKGQPVQFKIAVSNPGDGPARNVVIQAKLSPGLRHEGGEPNDQNLFEQTIDQIEPGQRIPLDPLVADTIAAGDQSCTVQVQSGSVTTNLDDTRGVASVTVVEPRLKIGVTGDEKRFTDTVASYAVTVENPGTATAHNVRVLATLPVSGRLVGPPPAGARWDPSSGKLLWTLPQVEPGEKEKVVLPFQVRVGNVGFYQVTVDARGEGGLSDKASVRTDVVGLVDFEFEVLERRRVVDIDDTTVFQVRLKNVGTKEATNILVRAGFSKNVEPTGTTNSIDDRTETKYNPEQKILVFPPIDRLAPGKEVILGIKVQAKEKGIGTCKVSLMHDDLAETEALEDMASFRITSPKR